MSQVSETISQKVEALGGNKSKVARQLKISPQLLGHYMSGRNKPKVEFYDKWREVYGEDLLKTNVSTNKPVTSVTLEVPVQDHIKAITGYNEYLQNAVQASLNSILDNILAGRAEVRGSIDYQVMKDSKGDEKKRVALKEQINKLIHLNLTGDVS